MASFNFWSWQKSAFLQFGSQISYLVEILVSENFTNIVILILGGLVRFWALYTAHCDAIDFDMRVNSPGNILITLWTENVNKQLTKKVSQKKEQ